jgi:mRNA interferase MazF
VKRGDAVTVAASGDYEKPRPAVIVQTDALPAEHASVIVCQMTSDVAEAPDFRVTIEPTERNGLRTRSQITADKPVTIRRERVGRKIGSLDDKNIARLKRRLSAGKREQSLHVSNNILINTLIKGYYAHSNRGFRSRSNVPGLRLIRFSHPRA